MEATVDEIRKAISRVYGRPAAEDALGCSTSFSYDYNTPTLFDLHGEDLEEEDE